MIPTPGSSRVHSSSDTTGTRSQRQSSAQTSGDHDDHEPPPGAPDPMPWPPVDSTFQEGEGEDIALEEELARQAGRIYLRWDGGNCWNKVRKGTTKISWVFYNYYREFVPQFSMASDEMVRFWWDRWRSSFAYSAAGRVLEAGGLQEAQGGQQAEQGVLDGWITSYGGSTTYEATRDRMTAELGRTPTHSEVFARTHTRKEDQLWVDKRSADVNWFGQILAYVHSFLIAIRKFNYPPSFNRCLTNLLQTRALEIRLTD
ncbi:hypothetical protein PIB30_104607 [Stylosanthes scabra]|uniref:Uncharacterized protein n=1 Tax=Stylosanthes scabra TaxID=79078 RepID=A0ABU6TXX5_9FABA|nr:hypothetical protein [Stylosanthes scabra]